MSLLAHYDAMRAAALPRLASGDADLDPLLDAAPDTRRGITLLTRPPAPILATLAGITADLRAHEPGQYYQPATDIHLTILSIISCYAGFTLAGIDPQKYQAIAGGILQRTLPFSVEFRGLTASAGGILAQGFPQDEALAELRAELRLAFRAAGVQQSIDQRYRIRTAHATLVRFRQPLRQPAQLVAALARYREVAIGTWEVRSAELVFNDWYQRKATTTLLEKYPLAAGNHRPGPPPTS